MGVSINSQATESGIGDTGLQHIQNVFFRSIVRYYIASITGIPFAMPKELTYTV